MLYLISFCLEMSLNFIEECKRYSLYFSQMALFLSNKYVSMRQTIVQNFLLELSEQNPHDRCAKTV